jgi:hypothetical protein
MGFWCYIIMKHSYSIEEILNAVNNLQTRKSEKKTQIRKNKSFQEDNSAVPKNTLRLIEEAEKLKNQ